MSGQEHESTYSSLTQGEKCCTLSQRRSQGRLQAVSFIHLTQTGRDTEANRSIHIVAKSNNSKKVIECEEVPHALFSFTITYEITEKLISDIKTHSCVT